VTCSLTSLHSCGLALLVLAAGCSRGNDLVLKEDAAGTREVILRVMPLGTSVHQAEGIMTHNGFACSDSRDASFGEHRHIDFLWCDRKQMEGLILRRWQVALIHQGDQVQDIDVAVGLIGP
jgi:hypothetical protein